jgi:hypothetical protein
MNKHLEEIIEKAIAYQTALESSKKQIEENRKVWNAETNKLIVETFQCVTQKVPNINWEIKNVGAMENLDLLSLGFKSESSGIVGQVEGVFKFFAKIGGKLIYSQVYNGEIYVLIDYPHIEGHVERQSPKFLDKYEPSQISADIILDHINIFLEEMLSWESGTRKLIGFVNG